MFQSKTSWSSLKGIFLSQHPSSGNSRKTTVSRISNTSKTPIQDAEKLAHPSCQLASKTNCTQSALEETPNLQSSFVLILWSDSFYPTGSHSGPNIFASTGESQKKARGGFARLPANVSILRGNNVKVLSGVNAHQLGSQPALQRSGNLRFDRIVCNFPCIGSSTYGKHVQMRKWLDTFLQSAEKVLSPSGQIWLTLKQGQGEHHQWQLALQVQKRSMSILKTRRFQPANGYQCRRGHDWDSPFPADDGVTHIIVSASTR